MKKRFRSKIGFVVVLPCLVILVLPFIVAPVSSFTLVLLLFDLLIVLPPFFGTYYQIDGNCLRIKFAFLITWEVDISSIVSIRRTNNPISSPALSLDRIQIDYDGGSQSVIISPLERVNFIACIKERNQSVQLIGRA